MIALSKPWIGDEEREAVLRVLDSGMLANGPEVAALEREWADACGAAFAVASSSGTTALHLALLAHGVGPGDEVITTAFSFAASAHAILHVGARPVFVDVHEDSFNIDVSRIRNAATSRTKAILGVHLYGLPCDIRDLRSLAAELGVVVIEDAAQAIGAHFENRPIGSFGTTCFSLYATKNVMAAEGGMVTTNDEKIAATIRTWRSHGRVSREEHDVAGFNFRMSELHAAIAREQLRRLPMISDRRATNAHRLCSSLRDAPGVIVPSVPNDRTHAWHQFTIRLPAGHRDAVADELASAGISSAVFYRTPLPFQRSLRSVCAIDEAGVPVASKLSHEVLSIPVHPLLAEGEVDQVARATLAAIHGR